MGTTYTLLWANLVSIASRVARNDDVGGDLDFTTMDYMSYTQNADKEQYSQEIRLESPEEKENWSWILGVFYSKSDYETNQVFNFGSSLYHRRFRL